jgi:fused signal recognition particle receptor
MFKFFRKTTASVKGAAVKFFHLIFPHFIDESSICEVENMLYDADFGCEVVKEIIEEIRIALKRDSRLRRDGIVGIASAVLRKNLAGSEAELQFDGTTPVAICLVGVNGSGKTTVAAKLANFYGKLGKKTLLASCDTFRAAANEQLISWGKRLGVEVIGSQRGADPAAVAFDAHRASIARHRDLLILDTAGRLHVKSNLMAELQKITRALKKSDANLQLQMWLVADGTIGANTIESAKIFHEEVGLTGLVITKLDGSSAGGALVGVYKKFRTPIYFIGTGETPESLEKFSIDSYVSGLFREN